MPDASATGDALNNDARRSAQTGGRHTGPCLELKGSTRDRLWQDMAEALKAANPKLTKKHIAEAIFKGRKWRGVGSAATISRRIKFLKSEAEKFRLTASFLSDDKHSIFWSRPKATAAESLGAPS